MKQQHTETFKYQEAGKKDSDDKVKRLLLIGLLLALIPTATALDLSNYPDMFIKNGTFDGVIVVGKDAPSQDVASAIELIPGLQAESKDRITGNTLDTHLSDYQYQSENIISIGCENQITQKITGLDCDDYTPTKGYIYLYENKYGKAQLVIAGGTPDDTEKAATLLGKYNEYELEGNAYIVEMQDELVQATLPKTPEEKAEEEEENIEKEVEEEIKKIKEQAKKEDEEEEEKTSEEQEKLQRKIERLLEEPEVEDSTPEPKEEASEKPPVDPEAPLHVRIWQRFKNWLDWFFK